MARNRSADRYPLRRPAPAPVRAGGLRGGGFSPPAHHARQAQHLPLPAQDKATPHPFCYRIPRDGQCLPHHILDFVLTREQWRKRMFNLWGRIVYWFRWLVLLVSLAMVVASVVTIFGLATSLKTNDNGDLSM